MSEVSVFQKLSYKVVGFTKRNAPTLLTSVGAVGLVATSVATAKAATKASDILRVVEEEKGEELTVLEKVRVATPVYIPAILFGTATLACMFGANALNKRKQASLVGAYAMLDRSFKEYKGKVKELYGEEGHGRVTEEIVKDHIDEAPEVYWPENELFYDLYSGRYFENTMENILEAEKEINKRMHTGYGDSGLNDFYELVGLARIEEFEELGWNAIAMEEMYWHAWIEFTHRKIVTDDGLECIILEFPLEPIIGYLEY